MFYAVIRLFLRFVIVGAGLAAFLIFMGWWFSPTLETEPVAHDREELERIEAMREVGFDPADPPVVQQDVDYSEGREGAWYPRNQSPLLDPLVEEGRLPPVEERVGSEPLVLDGVDGPGNYGGTWLRVANSPHDVGVISWRIGGSSLVRWSPMGYPIRPHIAKGWEASSDLREWTFYLREGARWSDGAPFTADDILYWYEDEHLYFEKAPPPWLTTSGKEGKVVKVDDYTVKFVFEEPNGVLLEGLATSVNWPPFAPAHYLRQYHPEQGDRALIEAELKARGLNSERALYQILKDFRNTEHPRMWPWIYRTYKPNPPEGFVRNPYYFAVDAEGNQLPYIDRILFEVKSPKLLPIAVANGGVSMQARHLRFSDYTLLMENREDYDYHVKHWFNAVRSDYALWPNLNRRILPDDPSSEWKAKFLREKKFRQALSLAIDRDQIVDAVYAGQGEPAQIDPGALSEFASEKLRNSFIEYDPERAGEMLDELGLSKRDSEGMRTFPDGSRMTWYLNFTDYTGEGPGQFVVDDWAEIGVRAVLRERARPLWSNEMRALLQDFSIWSGESEFNPMVEPRSFLPSGAWSLFAPAYGTWFQRDGLHGSELARAGMEPPEGGPIRRSMEIFDEARRTSDREKQVELFSEIFDVASENLWSISIATPPPNVAVVANNMRGVPDNVLSGASYQTPNNASPETFYFADVSDSPGAIAQMRREMLESSPPPDSAVPQEASASEKLGDLLVMLFLGIAALGLILSGVRHPYIGRRLLIMIPTLFIISLVTFTIIQMPPGDFVETRILELQLQGDDAAIDEMEQLRETFRLDEPVWRRYIHWLGIEWFLTYAPADRGLLQGDMGRSMETRRSVNDMVGDRVLLTFLVSLGTILFTWVVALPIGIYSAVRQYSIGDYLLTFLGFIGMCIPNFLLAILLMYWSGKYLGINVTGLFSPEMAATPEWTWAKFADLLMHLWVPIVVIALSGTAGMIRVMRGNLLDELRKPYVTTAMAKGVRPFKLLMKYPVRLALNPFVSGIGGIFPQLVSGGAIVAIVLSLPMVGPLLLAGLMMEDLYLAASMLMILSALGIFGTLVSDLLLLWIDPRIRMEGGNR